MAMKEIKITDFEGLQIGNAENTEAATGCTVPLFGWMCAAGDQPPAKVSC